MYSKQDVKTRTKVKTDYRHTDRIHNSFGNVSKLVESKGLCNLLKHQEKLGNNRFYRDGLGMTCPRSPKFFSVCDFINLYNLLSSPM